MKTFLISSALLLFASVASAGGFSNFAAGQCGVQAVAVQQPVYVQQFAVQRQYVPVQRQVFVQRQFVQQPVFVQRRSVFVGRRGFIGRRAFFGGGFGGNVNQFGLLNFSF